MREHEKGWQRGDGLQESRSKPGCYHGSCLVLWSPFAPGLSPFEE